MKLVYKKTKTAKIQGRNTDNEETETHEIEVNVEEFAKEFTKHFHSEMIRLEKEKEG